VVGAGVMLLALAWGAAVSAATIEGKVANPQQCLGVQALLRHGQGVKYPCLPRIFPGTYDGATGRFRIENLPAGAYDLRLIVPGGRVDGVDMRPIEESDEPFTGEDERMIRDFIANYPDSFIDIHRPICIRGNGRHAKVILECIRARRFHSGKPNDIIWRVEVWRFEKHTGAWIRPRRSAETVARLRVLTAAPPRGGSAGLQMSAGTFRELVWLFSPDLGRFELEADQVLTGLVVSVPEISAANGKVAGSVESQVEEYHRNRPEPYLE